MSSDHGRTLGNGYHTTGENPKDHQRTASPSALLTSDSKSPLKIPQGVIVRTPSGKDCQGRKTPPRFFAITNERLQHNTANSESIGPTHFKFQCSNKSASAVKQCVCKHSQKKSDVNCMESPKVISGHPGRIGGTVTLRSLLEAEIRKSNVSQTSNKPQPSPRKSQGRLKDQPLSPRSTGAENSSRMDKWMLNHKDTLSPGSLRLSNEKKEPTITNQNIASKTKTNYLKQIHQGSTESKNGRAVLDQSSKSEGCPGTSQDNILKGGLLDMLLSSNESLCEYRKSRDSQEEAKHMIIGKNTGITSESWDQKTILEQTETKLTTTPLSKESCAFSHGSDGSQERHNSSAMEISCSKSCQAQGTSEASTSKKSPNVCTEFSPRSSNTQGNVSPSVLGRDISTHIPQDPRLYHSEGGQCLATIKTEVQDNSCKLQKSIDTSSVTQSKQSYEIAGISGSSEKAFENSTEVLKVSCEIHGEKSGLGNLSKEVKKRNENVIASDNAEIRVSTAINDGKPVQEQRSKCPPKTMLIINPVKTASAPSSKGQLYGLVRSSTNAPGTMMLVALGGQRQGTTLTSSSNDAEAVKCQSPVLQKISDIKPTDKSFVHRALNRLNPKVVKQPSSSNPKKTKKEVVSIKPPKSKSCKDDIERQINVIPKLQTTGTDQPVTEKKLESEQDVLRELYKSTNMAAISPEFPMASNNSTFKKITKSSSDFLNDPESSFDPVFAHCLLSGRPHDIDNWMAMKTNWRVTPEWIVDFLTDCDQRKRARRAAIDAGVMRRVANAQRMAGMKDDDDDSGSSISKVQTPSKHSGKKCSQFGDSTENIPLCREEVCENNLAGGSNPKLDASPDEKGSSCLTPDKVQTETGTMANASVVINPIPQDQPSPLSEKLTTYRDSRSSSCAFMVKTEPHIRAGIQKEQSHQTVCSDITLPKNMPREDEHLMNTLPIQKIPKTETTVSQAEDCTSQEQNLFGDLDRIVDEQLWNLQCSLFPPWQRVSSFIGADAADDFFRDLDRDSQGEPIEPSIPNAHTGQVYKVEVDRASAILSDNLDVGDSLGIENETRHIKDCLESRSIAPVVTDISSISPVIPNVTRELQKAPDFPHAKRRLFCYNQSKTGSQSEEHETIVSGALLRCHNSKDNSHTKTLNTNENFSDRLESSKRPVSGKGAQTHPTSREEEEKEAICKLLEILHETQPSPSNTSATKEEIANRNTVSETCWTTEEKTDLMDDDKNNFKSGENVEEKEIQSGCLQMSRHMLSQDAGSRDDHVVQMGTSKTEKEDTLRSSEISRWQEEIKPIIALAVNSSSSSSSVENEIGQTQSKDDPRTTPIVELRAKCDESVACVEDRKDGDSANNQEQSKVIPTTSSSSGEYLTADETEQHSRGLDNRQTPDICQMLKEKTYEETPQCIMTVSPEVSKGGAAILENDTEGDVSDVSDGVVDEDISIEEKKMQNNVERHLRKSRKKRKEDTPQDRNIIFSDSSRDVTQSSSDTSLTSDSTSFTSFTCIAANRKGRGMKRRRKAQIHHNKSGRNNPRNCFSQQQSIKSEKMNDRSSQTQQTGKNNSKVDASNDSTDKKEPKDHQETDIAKLHEEEGGSKLSQDARHSGHEEDDHSDDDSQGEFVVADRSPTSLKIVKRRSSRLKIRRVSSLPRLRTKRKALGAFKKSASRSKLHVKVKSVERKKKN